MDDKLLDIDDAVRSHPSASTPVHYGHGHRNVKAVSLTRSLKMKGEVVKSVGPGVKLLTLELDGEM